MQFPSLQGHQVLFVSPRCACAVKVKNPKRGNHHAVPVRSLGSPFRAS